MRPTVVQTKQPRAFAAVFSLAAALGIASPVAAQTTAPGAASPASGGAPAAVNPAMPQAEPRPMASLPGGPIGTDVFVSMSGGTPGRAVTINFGGLTGYELVSRTTVPDDGVLATTVKVPEWAERNGVYFFFLNFNGTRVFSDPFIVTGPAGEVAVTGQVTKVEGNCVVLEGVGTSYALADLKEMPATGALLMVEGVLGIRAGGTGGAFPCVAHNGIPVRVTAVKGR